jgi:hypothetical protein
MLRARSIIVLAAPFSSPVYGGGVAQDEVRSDGGRTSPALEMAPLDRCAATPPVNGGRYRWSR